VSIVNEAPELFVNTIEVFHQAVVMNLYMILKQPEDLSPKVQSPFAP
jgi:hypothetical protein